MPSGGREGSGSLVSERPAASVSDPEGGLSVLTVGQANQSSLSVLLGVRGWERRTGDSVTAERDRSPGEAGRHGQAGVFGAQLTVFPLTRE